MRWLSLMLLALVAGPVYAEVFRWVDESGTVHFADERPREGESERIGIRDINTAKSVEVAPADTRHPATGDPAVVLYSASWCGYCDRARASLRAHDIPFGEYDVETTRRGRRDYAAMGVDGVPVILVGDRRMVGFSVDRFEAMYDG